MKAFLSLVALTAIGAFAAQHAAEPAKFEVASVKRTAECAMENSLGPGEVSLRGNPLKPILSQAFQASKEQIQGPSWLDEDCFDIAAKPPEGAGRDQIPEMLRALLVDRFRLTFHKDNGARNIYALVVDKNGPKFKESAPPSNGAQRTAATRFVAGPGISGLKGSMTMAYLASRLSARGYGLVRDFTGLTGKYDIDLSWAPDRTFEPMGAFARAAEAGPPNLDLPPPPAVGLFEALRESLGLRLEQRKEPVEVLVIDHIERVPSGN